MACCWLDRISDSFIFSEKRDSFGIIFGFLSVLHQNEDVNSESESDKDSKYDDNDDHRLLVVWFGIDNTHFETLYIKIAVGGKSNFLLLEIGLEL